MRKTARRIMRMYWCSSKKYNEEDNEENSEEDNE